MIIFIAGGVTYSEMRLAYTLGQSLGKDIYIGELAHTCVSWELMVRVNSYLDAGKVLQGHEISWSRWYRGEPAYCPS